MISANLDGRSPSGKFISLAGGLKTYYELAGPDNRETAVFIHGFSIPSFVWDYNFDFLAQAGVRVLRYDCYGHGLSDKPFKSYSRDYYCGQLNELLETLRIKSGINLIGLSMGGVIAADYANRYPGKVNKIVLISPAGMSSQPLILDLIKLPYLGEAIVNFFGTGILTLGVRKDFQRPHLYPEYIKHGICQLKDAGFAYSLISTLRNNVLFNAVSVYRELGRKNKKICLIWGKNDLLMPYRLHKKFLEIFPASDFHTIGNAGHASNYERPDAVNKILLRFLMG